VDVPIATVNPATGAVVQAFEAHDGAFVDSTLARASSAAAAWRRMTPADRAPLLARVAKRLDAEQDALARLATLEMGKTLRSARDEVAKCAFACRHYAAEGPRMLAAEAHTAADFAGTVRYDPLGVVLAVMPWNFPYWQVIRAAAPAIIAGNAVVLKHASNVPQCALALERIFRDAGAPDGLFTTLLIPAAGVAGLIADPRVAAVTVTGSEAAGRNIAASAGHVTKKCVLELGGSDPFIVLADADVERAAQVAVTSRMLNNGQSCICAKRFIVDARVADAFEAAFVARVRTLTVGDPFDDATDVGPLATAQGVADIASQVDRTVRAGATLLVGGSTPQRPGWYFEPTVLRDVPRDSPAAREELFGPVAPIFRVNGVAEAIALANDTLLGLGSSVWTRDAALAEQCTSELDVGMVFVNAMAASDPRIPFGGVKGSGYGREVGVHGLREFVNVKTVRGSVSG
jgi:succinate-semialdehyde dehydrogenase/glutarate-semialdehyde dehydrogenase